MYKLDTLMINDFRIFKEIYELILHKNDSKSIVDSDQGVIFVKLVDGIYEGGSSHVDFLLDCGVDDFLCCI